MAGIRPSPHGSLCLCPRLSSQYRIDGKVVSLEAYNHRLEGYNILVKARNFLVFQASRQDGAGLHGGRWRALCVVRSAVASPEDAAPGIPGQPNAGRSCSGCGADRVKGHWRGRNALVNARMGFQAGKMRQSCSGLPVAPELGRGMWRHGGGRFDRRLTKPLVIFQTLFEAGRHRERGADAAPPADCAV